MWNRMPLKEVTAKGERFFEMALMPEKSVHENQIGYANFKIVYTILRWEQAIFVFLFYIVFGEEVMISLRAGVLQKTTKNGIVFVYTKYQNPAKCL